MVAYRTAGSHDPIPWLPSALLGHVGPLAFYIPSPNMGRPLEAYLHGEWPSSFVDFCFLIFSHCGFLYLLIYLFTPSLMCKLFAIVQRTTVLKLLKLYTVRMNGQVEANLDSGTDDTHEQNANPTEQSAAALNETPPNRAVTGSSSSGSHGHRVLDETPTNENAQRIFPQSFCIYVGNLSNRTESTKLRDDLQETMSRYGRCYVNIKYSDRNPYMPSGFVQFEERDTAERAYGHASNVELHGRKLRLEWSQAHTLAAFCRRSNIDITELEARKQLDPTGEINSVQLRQHSPPFEHNYAIVNFATHGCYAKALQTFHNNREYYLCRAEMDGSHQHGLGEGNRPNQHSQNRNWNNGRNTRPYRAWGSGNGHGNGNRNSNGHGNGHGSGHSSGHSNGYDGYNGYNGYSGNGNGHGNNGGNGRSGVRNGRHQDNFSGQHPAQIFNAPGNSPGFPPRDYNGGNNFPPALGGPGNFNQGYNPNANYYPQGNSGNVPLHFSPGYPFGGGFANQVVFPPQMPSLEGSPFPHEYPGMMNNGMMSTGMPMFGQYPSVSIPPMSLPPMMTMQHQPLVESPQQTVQLPEPLICSSQPQHDTDHHRERYPREHKQDQESTGTEPNWSGSPGCYTGSEYGQYHHMPDPRSRQPSLEASGYEGSPSAEAFESSDLAQIPVGPSESETTDKGRQFDRENHSNTDGGSDVPYMNASVYTQSEPLPEMTDLQEGAVPTESEVEPSKSHSEHIELENNPNEPVVQPTTPEPTEDANDPCHAPVAEKEHEESSDEAVHEPEVEAKSTDSAETDDAPGLKTPDTDESQELANNSSSSRAESQETVVLYTTTAFNSPRNIAPEAVPTDRIDKGKLPAREQSPAKGKSPAKGNSPAKGKSPAKGYPRLNLARRSAPETSARGSLLEHKPLKQNYADMVKKDPSFKFHDSKMLEEAIHELEEEQRQKVRAEEGLGPNDESPTSGSPKSPKAPKAKSVA